jgi:hypothetical protein
MNFNFKRLFFSVFGLAFFSMVGLKGSEPSDLKKEKEPFKSISTTAPSAVAFGSNTFEGKDFYYLGANAEDKGKYALCRAYVYTDTSSTTAVNRCALKTLAPQNVVVNYSSASSEDPVATANPFYNASIRSLTGFGKLPVAVLEARNSSYSHNATTGVGQTICSARDAENGDKVSVNIVKFKDAVGVDGGGIKAVTGGSDYVFAAVGPASVNFGADQTKSGIALASIGDAGISQVNSKDGASGVCATPLTAAGVALEDHVAMFWDSSLSRLFVGLGFESKSDSAGVHALLVGRMNSSKLFLEAAIDPSAVGDNANGIVAFAGGTSRSGKIYNIHTMHTSTGKSYVVVVGGVGKTQQQVFALPICRHQYEDSSLAAATVGKIATATSISQHDPAAAGSLSFIATDASAIVGDRDAPGNINHMFCEGDAVYIFCETGIFQSTAIFDENGLICDWTPWQRVMGAKAKALGGRVEGSSGNFWYLTEATAEGDTVKVSQSGKGDSSLLGNLRVKLEEEFPFDNAGVHQMFDFPIGTGFASGFSMMVATGYRKVALIRTSKGTDEPTTGNDFDTAANFKTYSGGDLSDLGPICSAAVSRDNKYLFVGGYGGVAVLSTAVGAGWASGGLADLSDALTGFTFKKIGSFSNVFKLVCDGDYLYVLSQKGLYRISITTAAKFTSSPSALGQVLIAGPGVGSLSSMTSDDSLMDFVVSSKLGILATTGGLFRVADAGDISIVSTNGWTEVKTLVETTEYGIGEVVHMHPISKEKTSFNSGGNLYVLAASMSNDLASIFRFNVADTSATAIDSSSINPIVEPKVNSSDRARCYFYNSGKMQSSFVTDGAFCNMLLPKHFGKNFYLLMSRMLSRPDLMRAGQRLIDLDMTTSAHNIGTPVLNSASGARMYPCCHGIRLNE